MKTSKKREPDLTFEREFGPDASQAIEFYVDDNYLEIKTINSDSDVFIIVLNPLEIHDLRDLLKRLT